MGIAHYPSIVLDKLVLYYDAANSKSYSGSGVIINNLSENSNYNARIRGSRVTFSASQKAFEYTGTSDSSDSGIYIEGLNYVTGSADAFSNMTVECWCKSNSAPRDSDGDQRIILSFDRSAVFRFAIGADASSIRTQARGKPSLQWMNNTSVIDNYADTYSGDLRDDQWHQVGVTFTRTAVKYYVDGVNVDTHTGSWSPLSNHSENETPRYGYIGNGSEATSAGGGIAPGDLFFGFISNLKYYYKTLSDAEMKQNFEALKGRFGI